MERQTRLTRESFSNLASVQRPAQIPVPKRVWSSEDWAQLSLGHRAAEMEDKWHAYVERDRLFLHRSWTGRGIYEALFGESELGWAIVEVVVESDPDSYQRHGDEAETLLLELTIESVLLDRFQEQKWRRWAQLVGADERRDPGFDLLLHHLVGDRRGRAMPQGT